MKEFKGTQGKWYCNKNKKHPTLHHILSSEADDTFYDGTLIAKTCYAPLSEYNALLISKAPEMLFLLKDLLSDKGLNDVSRREVELLIKQATEL